jgi:microcystin-dependent protein
MVSFLRILNVSADRRAPAQQQALEESMEPYLGEIRLFPYNFVPAHWAACNGALLQISHNTALFSLLGTAFGGDGQTNFALPNLGQVTAVNGGQGTYCIALQGQYPQRD